MADMDFRITGHVVLDTASDAKAKIVEIEVDGRRFSAREGEPVLSALLANGIRINRYTAKRHEPRGLFCGIGQCTDCAMVVNGHPNVRTCITPVEAGMIIKTQNGIEEGL
jgi:predicted molibdopterin-dependent oxidoreductase YjgC